MNLIIDGYNLIKRIAVLRSEDRVAPELGREALLVRLAAYKKFKPHKITVVFDGSASVTSSPGSEKGIRVVYSRHGKSADDVIRTMAQKYKTGCSVVTSDRSLGADVEKAGGCVIKCEEFWDHIESAFIWDNYGKDEQDEEPIGRRRFSTKKKGPSRRPARKERVKARRIRKL